MLWLPERVWPGLRLRGKIAVCVRVHILFLLLCILVVCVCLVFASLHSTCLLSTVQICYHSYCPRLGGLSVLIAPACVYGGCVWVLKDLGLFKFPVVFFKPSETPLQFKLIQWAQPGQTKPHHSLLLNQPPLSNTNYLNWILLRVVYIDLGFHYFKAI